MQSTWRKHLVICLLLGLLAIPIYLLDLALTEKGGGNWITLDFRGLIFWTYIALLAIDVALSSIGIVSFPKSGVLRIHFCSMVLSVILLVVGFILREAGAGIEPANSGFADRDLTTWLPRRWCEK